MKHRIGNLKLENRALLAPMLEPNDVVFRLLCRRAGCGLTWTGMTSALSRQKLDLDDAPVLQLFGNSVRGIGSFMERHDDEVSGWDFNLGCPSKLSRRLGHGACLDDLDVIERILKVMRGNTEKFLCVKIRKSVRGLEIARLAERCGVDAVCVHARTLSQGYSGDVDYDWALDVKRAVGVPVIFSGVSDLDSVEGILRDFDFVMLGRLAIGRPGVFGEIDGGSGRVKKSQGEKDESFEHENKNSSWMNADERGFGFGEYLELAEKFGIYFRQVKYQAMNWTKGIVRGKELRRRLVETKDAGEVRGVMGSNK